MWSSERGQGLGRQTCHALTQCGAAKIVCVDIDAERLRISRKRSDRYPVDGDVTKRDEARRLGEFAEEQLGVINGFVDIVGMARWASSWTWTTTIGTGRRHERASCIPHSQEIVKRMVASGRHDGVHRIGQRLECGRRCTRRTARPRPASVAYVQSLAVELGPLGVRANQFAPGVILTRAWRPRSPTSSVWPTARWYRWAAWASPSTSPAPCCSSRRTCRRHLRTHDRRRRRRRREIPYGTLEVAARATGGHGVRLRHSNMHHGLGLEAYSVAQASSDRHRPRDVRSG